MLSKRKVLVLNKLWIPCSVVTLRRAISLLCKYNAVVIDPEKNDNGSWDFPTYDWSEWEEMTPRKSESFISSVSNRYRIPELVLLTDYEKMPTQRMNFSNKALYSRDSNMCMYCGEYLDPSELTVDHIIPKSQGGTKTWENCVTSCSPCNSKKANRTPEQANMKFHKRDFKPFRPRYNFYKGDCHLPSWEHFLGKEFWRQKMTA